MPSELTPDKQKTQMSHEQVNDLRRKVLKGEEVSDEELREAIRFQASLRGQFASEEKAKAKVEKAQAKAMSKEEKQEKAQAVLDSLFKPKG